MTEALPVSIIAQAEALGMALLTIVQEHRDAPLATLEQAVLAAAQACLPSLLESVVEASTTALHAPQRARPQSCPDCGTRSRVQSWRPRQIRTICGPMQYTRPWYVCARCGHGWSPVDTTLEVARYARLSGGLAAWLAELGASTSFADAAGTLEKLTGLRVSPETVRQQTEQQGEAVEGVAQRGMVQVVRTREPADPVQAAPGTLLVETDGVMVRYRDGWHEVKLGLVAGHAGGKTVAPSYVAARASAEAFGPRLLAEVARRGALEVVGWQGSITRPGLAVLREVVVLGDGAPWIWNLAAEHFGERTEIVDFYHASEHVWAVGKALYGEGTAAARTWAGEHIAALREKGAGPVLRALAEAQVETAEAAEAVRRERGYFRTNAARMAYPTFRDRALPIGSGAVESSAKHLVQQRMKRSGARWSQLGAQAVLNVRCRLLSGLPLAS